MKKKIERLETVVVLCLEKIERLERLITELKPEEDENTQQD
jgi:hypothetical protein